MRKLAFVAALMVILSACGGNAETGTGGSDESGSGGNTSSSTAPDPCTLIDDTMRATYFGGGGGEGEPGEAGPIDSCRWKKPDGGGSLLIQVAVDYDLYKPDPCEGCIDLTFGDNGYASPSSFQSIATVIIGSNWYSVASTGFGDDGPAVAALLEAVVANAAE